MNKKLLFCLFISFLFNQILISNPVTLYITTADEHLEPYVIDDETTILNISNFIPPFNKFHVDSISGLEQLTALEVVQIQGLNTVVDFTFLGDAPNLKEIYITSCITSSLRFMENLKNAEIIVFDGYVTEDDYETIKNQIIDLSKLENLQKISFSAALLPAEEYIGFAAIPKFSYVYSNPDIQLGNNNIESISEEDIEILSQFNKIYLWPNPILFNDEEMKKLEGLNIISR